MSTRGTLGKAVSVVWERREPLLLHKWFNCNQELFLLIPLPSWIRYTWSSLSIWLPRNFNPPHVLRICSPCCFKSTYMYHQVSVCSSYRNERKLIRSIHSRKHMLSRGSIPDVLNHSTQLIEEISKLTLFKNTWVSFNLFVKLCSPSSSLCWIPLSHDFSGVTN